MRHLKLPAYGKRLLLARRAGFVPLVVHFIFGFRWFEEPLCSWSCAGAAHPKLALKPDDYVPRVYDFRVLTGLQVALFDQEAALGSDEPNLRFPVFSLIGEIAACSAAVWVHSPALDTEWLAHDMARSFFRVSKRKDPEHNHGWPGWWSADIEKNNAKRRETWLTVAFDRPELHEPASV